MTVSMAFLQLPCASIAAVATVRGNDMRHLRASESSYDSSSDTVEIGLDDHHERHGSIPKRKRLHKRHSDDFYLRHHLEESATDLEWSNPCNGFFEPSNDMSSLSMPPVSYFLLRLRRILNVEFHLVDDLKVISTNDLRPWANYTEFYSFLPKIKVDAKITLRRWYRQMQIYVATFAHLGRMQYNFDQKMTFSTSKLTKELNELLLSARSILCEIEATVNGSYPFGHRKLRSFTREEMNNRIQFLSEKRSGNHAKEPDMLDLKFAKYKYFHYLRRMWRVLRIRSRQRGSTLQLSKSLESYAMSEDNTNSSINELNLSESRSGLGSSSRSSSSASESLEGSVENGSHAGGPIKRNRSNRRKTTSRRKLQLNSGE